VLLKAVIDSEQQRDAATEGGDYTRIRLQRERARKRERRRATHVREREAEIEWG
jgi:hypothetical protein